MGLEPMSAGATIQCVNQLHHSRHVLKYIIISKNNKQHIFLVILQIVKFQRKRNTLLR